MQRHPRHTFTFTGATALFAASVFTAPGAWAADAASCHDKAVTIDGTGQAVVIGTEDADVIAAPAGSTVSALAGDDTICVLPGGAATSTSIDAGEGDDTVDTSALVAESTVTADLGPGDDSFRGGTGSDQVMAGGGADQVATGGGDDVVHSGFAGQPNPADLDLGPGDDVLHWHGIQAAGGSVAFGDGSDTLIDSDGGTAAIDAAQKVVTRGGEPVLVWDGSVTTYVVESQAAQVSFDGTDAAETFVVRDPAAGAATPTVDVDMGGGDDTMTLRSRVLDGSAWAGGAGDDLIQVAYDYSTIYLDLRSGQFETGAPDVTPDQHVSGVENVEAMTAAMTVKGDDSDNTLDLRGCSVTAIGRAGSDDISWGVDFTDRPTLPCTGKELVARGGKGDDAIVGSSGADRLLGHSGADWIKAKTGTDIVSGGADDDRLRGNAGDDKLRGGPGDDDIAGNGGNDKVQGDKGGDRLLAHGGDDKLIGGLGLDRGYGGKGVDRGTSIERRYNIER